MLQIEVYIMYVNHNYVSVTMFMAHSLIVGALSDKEKSFVTSIQGGVRLWAKLPRWPGKKIYRSRELLLKGSVQFTSSYKKTKKKIFLSATKPSDLN